MKNSKLLLGLALTSVAAGFTACSDNDLSEEGLINGKHPIMLSGSLNQNEAVTRSKGDGNGDKIPFESVTPIALSIKSDSLVTSGTGKVRGFNKTTATVTTEITTTPRTKVSFTNDEIQYWDDYFGRYAQLTIYAVGVEGKKAGEYGTTNKLQFAENTNNIAWTLSATQTEATYAQEDLLVSNNIKNGTNDDRLKHSSTTSFPTGNLEFTHATSKIIVNITKGEGVTTGNFADRVLKVNGFYTSGTMDASNGAFTLAEGAKTTDITPIATTANTYTVKGENGAEDQTLPYDYSYKCLVLPNRNWDTNSQIFTFTADGNTYNINTKMFNTQGSGELTGNIEAGKQYIFNIKFDKTQIELTAQVKGWDTADEVDLTPVLVAGSGIGVANLGELNNMLATFDLYRSTTVDNGYDAKTDNTTFDYATVVKYSDSKFSCNPLIYWPDHTTPYFFRGIGELDENGNSTEVHPTVTTADSKDYVAISTCKKVSTDSEALTKSGSDICMGAPYDAKEGTGGNTGKTAEIGNLTGAKLAKDGNVNLTFKHGLAEIYIQLLTTVEGDTDYNADANYTNVIDLSNVTINVQNSLTGGKYMLGTVQVDADATSRTASYSMGAKYSSTTDMTLPDGTTTKDNVYRCYVIPQDLAWTTGSGENIENHYITFEITSVTGTGENARKNTFTVDARNPQETTNTFSKWEAGNQYLYKITLKQSAIKVTATLDPWKVTGNISTNENVKL